MDMKGGRRYGEDGREEKSKKFPIDFTCYSWVSYCILEMTDAKELV
jgi:hypothetical protein